MLERLKWLVAGKELRALHRYRMACALAWRWNGQVPNSSETAEWISQVGEDQRGADISEFRARLECADKAIEHDRNQAAQPAVPDAPEFEGDTCQSRDIYAGNSVGWWKSKADNYGAGLLKVCAALGKIGIKMDGVTPCWEYVEKLSPANAQPAVPSVPEDWREDVSLAAQMLTWGRDEGLDEQQIKEIDAHAGRLFAMLAATEAATPKDQQAVPETWQDRLRAEHAELDARFTKLCAFLESDQFAGLHEDDRRILMTQANGMRVYLNALTFRVDQLDYSVPTKDQPAQGVDGA